MKKMFCITFLIIVSMINACETAPTTLCDESLIELSEEDVGPGVLWEQDGVSQRATGTWRTTQELSIIFGTTTISAMTTQDDTSILDALSEKAFPFCVPLQTRGAKNGSMNAAALGAITDDDHTGALVLLKNENDELWGRFHATLRRGNDKVEISDGKFVVQPQ